jgi:uncharacterized protein YbaP (TraB family)
MGVFSLAVSTRRLLALFTLGLACFLGPGHAQAQTQTARVATCAPTPTALTEGEMQDGLRRARDRGFLWRVTKDGRTSHLYGTIHLGKREWLMPGPTVREAALSSDVIAVEANLADPEVATEFQQGLKSRKNRTVSPALTRRLQAQLAANCVPAELASQMSPEMRAVTALSMSAQNDGLQPAYAVDQVFMGMGRNGRVEVVSLETVELQLGLLHGRNAQETEEFVASMVATLESGEARRGLVRQAQMWAFSRHDELARYEEWCDCTRTRAERQLTRRLLTDRNPALAERIDDLHGSGRTVFVAVGSLHMAGPGGLPALLDKRGYVVERVVFQR